MPNHLQVSALSPPKTKELVGIAINHTGLPQEFNLQFPEGFNFPRRHRQTKGAKVSQLRFETPCQRDRCALMFSVSEDGFCQ